MIKNILDIDGNIIGTMELPDDVPLDAVGVRLSEYLPVDPLAGMSDLEKLELKSIKYINFGINLYTQVKQKVWAINTLAASAGAPISMTNLMSLLSASDNLEKALKTGSLDTAIYICMQLKIALPPYASVADYAISQINSFLGR